MAVKETYQQYLDDPNPDNLNLVVDDLQPTINYTLTNLNSMDDPVVSSEARVTAGEAIQSYDPSYGASLETHVSNQLQKMNRVARRQRSSIRLPERQQLDAYHLKNSETEFYDQYGKEPTLEELADFSGFTPKKIEKVRNQSFAVVSEGTYEGNVSDEGQDYVMEALDYVYADSDRKDQLIMEYKLGYGGKEPKSSKEIAKILNLDPAQVSRRSAKILVKVNEYAESMEAVY
jgi:RNA polymerase primary sigma factor